MLVVIPFSPSNIQPFGYRSFALSDALTQRNVAGRIVKNALFVVLFPKMIPYPFLGIQSGSFVRHVYFFETDNGNVMKGIQCHPRTEKRKNHLLDWLWKTFYFFFDFGAGFCCAFECSFVGFSAKSPCQKFSSRLNQTSYCAGRTIFFLLRSPETSGIRFRPLFGN